MRMDRRWLYVLALGVAILIPASAFTAEECITHYSWKCDDNDPGDNDCLGIFAEGTQFVYTETASSPHKLWYALRFSPAASGSHYLRMSGISHSFQGLSTDEEFQAFVRQSAGCTEDGLYQSITTFDDSCCNGVADYSLGTSSTTDICIAIESSELDSNRDELQVDHDTNHFHPVIATKFPNDNWPDSEVTTLGSVISGGLPEVGRCTPDSYEELSEGGFQSRLWHTYIINNVPSGSAQTLYVGGLRVDLGDENESFDIKYKWSSTCTGTSGFSNSGITISSDTDTDYSSSISNSSGTLCVAVDDQGGGSWHDQVWIDHVYVVTTP